MKINGEFILREVVDEYVLIAVGDTALKFNGIIGLNPVSACIWKNLQEEKSREELLEAILDEFEVTREEAEKDMDEFLDQLREKELLV